MESATWVVDTTEGWISVVALDDGELDIVLQRLDIVPMIPPRTGLISTRQCFVSATIPAAAGRR